MRALRLLEDVHLAIMGFGRDSELALIKEWAELNCVSNRVHLYGPRPFDQCCTSIAVLARSWLGEGEVTLLELLDALSGRTSRPLGAVPGLVLRGAAGAIVRTPRREIILQLDALRPLPE